MEEWEVWVVWVKVIHNFLQILEIAMEWILEILEEWEVLEGKEEQAKTKKLLLNLHDSFVFIYFNFIFAVDLQER